MNNHAPRQIPNDQGNSIENNLFELFKEKLNGLSGKCCIKTLSMEPVDSTDFKIDDATECIVFLPFQTIDTASFSINLERVRKLRKKLNKYKIPFLFITPFDLFVPDFLQPENIKIPSIKKLLGTPEFGELDKATLFAEVFYGNDAKTDKRVKRILNFIPLSFGNNFFDRLYEKISMVAEFNTEEIGSLRKAYYDTFISYYDYLVVENGKDPKPTVIKDVVIKDASRLTYINQTDEIEYIKEFKENIEATNLKANKKCNDKTSIYDILEFADYIHCLLNGRPIPKKSGSHSISLEPFCAPYPFPLQELIDAEKEIREKLEKGNSTNEKGIKLLLIDNKIDKVKGKNGHRTLGDLFPKNSQIGDFFELRMLGNTGWTTISDLSNEDNFKEEKLEVFYFDKFRNELKAYKRNNSENQSLTNFKYLSTIYNKRIKKAHFVLLDFFLNKENTYLAFDFIRDMADIQRQQGDVSTIWYFITSAVYDSVVKYSQSGLLAEYYESAVVNAGDDPTNKKRRIIFLYKFLTFIHSRIKSVSRHYECVQKHFFLDDDPNGKKCADCVKYKEAEKDHPRHECIKAVQQSIKRFLAEDDKFASLIVSRYEDVCEVLGLLDDTLTKFNILPHADWQIIQHQIDFIRVKVNSLGIGKGFCCEYINCEMKKRSEIY